MMSSLSSPSSVSGVGAVVVGSVSSMIEAMAEEDHHDHCLICYDDLVYRSLLPCNHNDVCPVCMLRLRHLHKDRNCPICKQECEQVIVEETASQEHDLFSEYPVWGEELGTEFVYKADVGTFYRTEYYERVIQPLLSYPCLQCEEFNKEYGAHQQSLKVLQDHLRSVHRLQLCQLCTEYRRDFVSNLTRWTPAQLQTHFQKGDPGTAFTGHPLCEFCRPKRFYDTTQLYLHLNQEHYKCDLCDKQGIPNQFFKHYPSLQRHFHNQHFACQNPVCMQARFVVFESELDLRHHERQVHGATSNGSSKIALEFRYASSYSSRSNEANQSVPSQQDFDYTLDGQAFVPPELNNNNNDPATSRASQTNAVVDPLHRARTEQLRQRAAQVAQERGLTPQQPEAFPSLAQTPHSNDEGGTMAPATQFRAGWTSGSTLVRLAQEQQRKTPVGQITDAAFPSLPLANSASNSRGATAVPAPRPYRPAATMAAISSAAAPQGSWRPVTTGTTTATTTTTAPPPSSTNIIHNKTPMAPNLSSAELFPSLAGPGSSRTSTAGPRPPRTQPYSAAQALARQHQQQQQQQDQFPSLGVRITTAPKMTQPPTALQQPPPQWDNPSQFPAPPPSSAQAVVEDLKLILGKPKYKQLKRLTAEFSTGNGCTGKVYIDQVAALFDGGTNDSQFWNTVPSLVESCPAPTRDKTNALHYLDTLRTGAHNLKQPPNTARQHQTPPPPVTTTSWPGMSSSAVRSSTGKSSTSVWGSGANSTILKAKAPPGSVAVAATLPQQGPQSATKFMAQEQKKKTNAAATTKKKTNAASTKKQELRSLAFGS